MKVKDISEQLRAGFRHGMAGLLIVLVSGVVGYHLIEGWSWGDSFYMTIITVSTVGYEEIHTLSPMGRLFTSFLILFGVGLVAYSLSRLVEFLFQRSLTNVLGRRAMIKKISQMKDHSIICGYGGMGTLVAETLAEARRPFVVIEEDKAIADQLAELGIPHICGDCTEEEILESANIHHADSLVATLDSDAENLFLTLTAKGLSPRLRIIARVNAPSSARKLKKAGASRVISPIASGANQIAQLITRPAVVDLIELVARDENISLQILEHPIDEEDDLVGKTLAEARVRQRMGGMAIAIKHRNGTSSFDPGPDTQLKAGDILVIIHKPEAELELEEE